MELADELEPCTAPSPTVLPGSIDPSSRGQTSTLPRAMTVVKRGEKDFKTRQNRGGVYRGKFAAGEKMGQRKICFTL